MKNLSGLFAFFIAVLCVTMGFNTGSLVTKASAGELTKIVCKSGANMNVIVSPSAITDETWLQIRFIRARFAYESKAPAPGECTMHARAITADEPDILSVNLRANVWTEFKAVGTGFTNAGVLESRGDVEDQRKANAILNNARGGGFFTLEAYNTNEGYFKIVSIEEGVR